MINQSKKELIEILKNEQNSIKKRKNAIIRLAYFNDSDVKKILNYFSGSDHEVIRFYARWALKKIDFLVENTGATNLLSENEDSVDASSEVKNRDFDFDSPDSSDNLQLFEEVQDEIFHENYNSESLDKDTEELKVHRKDNLSVSADSKGSSGLKNSDSNDASKNLKSSKNIESFDKREKFEFINPDDLKDFIFPEKYKVDPLKFEPHQKAFWDELETENQQSKLIYKIRMASELEDESYIDPLIHLLEKTEDEHVAATVISALGLFNKANHSRLISAYLDFPDNRVKANAIESLGELCDKNTIKLILPFINDCDNRIKANAAKALYKFDTELVLDVIEKMVDSNSEKDKRSAVHALGCMTDQRSLALLKRLASEEAPDISAEAAGLVNKIEEKIRLKKERTEKYRSIVKNDKTSVKESEKNDKNRSSKKKSKSPSFLKDSKKLFKLIAILFLILFIPGLSAGLFYFYPDMVNDKYEQIKTFIENNMKDIEERDLTIGSEIKKDSSENSGIKVKQKIDQSGTHNRADSKKVKPVADKLVDKNINNSTKDTVLPDNKVKVNSIKGGPVSDMSVTNSNVIDTPASDMTVKDSNVKDNNVKVSSVKDNNVKVSSVKDNSVKDGVSPDNSTGNSGSEEDVAVDTDKNQSENLSTLFTDVQKAYLKKFSINIPNDKNSQAVLALYLDMVAAYNKKDINPIASIYSEDYVYSESNKKSALETIKEEFNIGPGIEMKIDSIKIKCDKNSALVDFVYYFEGKAEDGFAIEREYSLTPRKDFLQKTEGSWFLKKSE